MRRMIGDAAHRDPSDLPAPRPGEHDIQDGGGLTGILAEHFIKIPQAEKEDALGIFGLDFLVLLKHGGEGFHRAIYTINFTRREIFF